MDQHSAMEQRRQMMMDRIRNQKQNDNGGYMDDANSNDEEEWYPDARDAAPSNAQARQAPVPQRQGSLNPPWGTSDKDADNSWNSKTIPNKGKRTVATVRQNQQQEVRVPSNAPMVGASKAPQVQQQYQDSPERIAPVMNRQYGQGKENVTQQPSTFFYNFGKDEPKQRGRRINSQPTRERPF